jgi:leucyl/phenylalanyl-tRNA--protein transferase
MLRGYAVGAFAMGDDDGTIEWYDPDPRAILGPDGLHVSRSLRRSLDGRFVVTLDGAPEDVVRACAMPAPGREETWISEPFLEAVLVLLERGWVHTVEARLDGALVGGVYGVQMHGVFFAESMFSRLPAGTDASKVCLAHLWQHLDDRGIGLLDCQFLTPHLASLGFVEVPRAMWRRRLHDALMTHVSWT